MQPWTVVIVMREPSVTMGREEPPAPAMFGHINQQQQGSSPISNLYGNYT